MVGFRCVVGGAVVLVLLTVGCARGDRNGRDPDQVPAPLTSGTAAPTAPVGMPWLRRDGEILRAADGRQFMPRGLDYAYNNNGIELERFDLTAADLDLMRSWGANAVRIRVRDTHAGLYPSVPAEPSFVEGLDRLIAAINARGMYVVLAFGGPENLLVLDQHPGDPLFEQAKFLPGNPARAAWLDYLDGMFDRYRDWPGIIGFDPMNEDVSFSPELLDGVYLADAHRDVLARLRDGDTRHVYFQQTHGWTYQGSSVVTGHDLGDDNRFFCVKMPVTRQVEARMRQQVGWAGQSGAPLFVCEYALVDSRQENETDLALQDAAIALIERDAVGSFRLSYAPGVRSSMTEDGAETFWIEGYARPQPGFVGGIATAQSWDRTAQHLVLGLIRDGSGDTEVAVPPRRYPGGMTATTDAGDQLEVSDLSVAATSGELSWDPASQTLRLAVGRGPVALDLVPAAGPQFLGPPPARASNPTAPSTERPATATGPAAFVHTLVASGEFTAAQADCVFERLRANLSRADLRRLVGFEQLPPPFGGDRGGAALITGIGDAVHGCAGPE